MEISIKNEKENPLLQRKEIIGTISYTGATPSNVQLRDELAKKKSVAADVVVVKNISGKFGETTATFEAHIYASKEQHDKIEPKKKEKKAAEGQAPAPAKK